MKVIIIAYENGKCINRYTAKQIGKNKEKKRCKIGTWYWNRETYWKCFYLSGRRKYAKKRTNEIIRQNKNFDGNYGKYRLVFDYYWTIW